MLQIQTQLFVSELKNQPTFQAPTWCKVLTGDLHQLGEGVSRDLAGEIQLQYTVIYNTKQSQNHNLNIANNIAL